MCSNNVMTSFTPHPISQVGANSKLELVNAEPNSNYLSAITSMVCDENDDMIYIGGMFAKVTNEVRMKKRKSTTFSEIPENEMKV